MTRCVKDAPLPQKTVLSASALFLDLVKSLLRYPFLWSSFAVQIFPPYYWYYVSLLNMLSDYLVCKFSCFTAESKSCAGLLEEPLESRKTGICFARVSA